MTAMQIQEALLQAPVDGRLTLAAQLIARYHAQEDADLDAEERDHLIACLEAKLAARRSRSGD